MGTLTAHDTRLPEHCVHKLPTSCRLTSIPECCACADERSHAAAYSTYIDGVGYVLRGNRWQRYCWFCKEFWENRVQVSGLSHAQTRIPEVPDQTAFLDRWYDFQRGYRIAVGADGQEEHIPLICEDFKDVSPGCLPRTPLEMEQGLLRSGFDPQPDAVTLVGQLQTAAEPGPSLDADLDDMFAEAVREDTSNAARSTDTRRSNIHAQAMTALEPLAIRDTGRDQRRITSLRRELQRMRNGIERVIAGLRELGETIPEQTHATIRLERLGRALDNISTPDLLDSESQVSQPMAADDVVAQAMLPPAPLQHRVDEARTHLQEARRMHSQAVQEVHNAEQDIRVSQRRLQQLQREQRTAENYTRLFGTREEMQAQGDNYESPIGGMFTRAWDRFRAAEEIRQEERTLRHVLADESATGGEVASRRLEELDNVHVDVWGVPRSAADANASLTHQDTSNTTQLMEMARDEVFSGQSQVNEQTDETEQAVGRYYNMLRRQGWSQTHNDSIEQPPQETRQEDNAFPLSMLAAHPTTQGLVSTSDSIVLPGGTLSPPRMSQSTIYEQDDTNLRLDLEYLIFKMSRDVENRLSYLMSQTIDDVIGYLNAIMESADESVEIRRATAELFANDNLIWAIGLPAEHSRRLWENGTALLITDNPESEEQEEERQNIEAMAEAFQRSADLRRSSGLNSPERLRMLHRLQCNERVATDRTILQNMLKDSESLSIAREILVTQAAGLSAAQSQQVSALNEQRLEQARNGQHSRQELQDMRRATSALAIAAGRTAMQAGPHGAMQRMLDMHNEMREEARFFRDRDDMEDRERATLRRRQQRHRRDTLATLDDSSSDSNGDNEDQDVGLDARDSGRPEPKSDEEMTVKMECNICFSQVADVACLPCGHLVMCKWCSDQHSPVMNHDRTRPRRPATCPACRKQIKQKLRVFRV